MKGYIRRFANLEESNNTKRAILYVFLTIVALAILYFLGIPALGKLTSLMSSLKGNSSKIGSSDMTPPAPPKFKNLPEFTNQQGIAISGYTESGATVLLTFNGEQKETLADSNGQFTFNLTLLDGANSLSAIVTDPSGNQSQRSEAYQINLDVKKPELQVTSPNDGSTFFGSNQRQVTIQGTTEEEAKITINDRIISVDDTGIFQYTTTLNDGANTFNIKSTDQAGNMTEKNITLSFTP